MTPPAQAARFGVPNAWRGLLLGVATAGLIEALRLAQIRIPNPPALLLPVVVLTAFWLGLRAGLAASAVAILYNFYAFSAPGRLGHYSPDDWIRVALWAVTIPGTAWAVGWLRDRLAQSEQQALKLSEERFAKAFDASPLAMAVIGLEGGFVLQANAAFLALLRLPAGALPTQSFSQLTQGALRATPAWHEETVLQPAEGPEVTTLASFERIDFQGRPCLLAFFYDVTERRRLEENLRQAQKLEAIGRLAGGIAHDFNNLLMVINSAAELLTRPTEFDEDPREVAQEILTAGQRATELTSQLLAFSRKQPLRWETLSLNDVVTRGAPLLKRLLHADIVVRTSLEPGLHLVKGDRTQLDQVLLNLVMNAGDAMPHGGTLDIATTNVSRDGVESASLAVTDTGEGIDPAVLPHLFEPFFTTRARGKGTGLGLAIVYGAIKQAGGDITVESQIGRGSTFRVLLPRTAAEEAGAASTGEPAAQVGAGETILVAEDEPAVRAVVIRTLRNLRYQVLEASDGASALTLASAHPGRIDLLLTDVVMPGMNGRVLAERLTALRPTTPVLFMSGYTDDAELEAAARQKSVALLPKPFSSAALAHAVRQALANSSRAAGGS